VTRTLIVRAAAEADLAASKVGTTISMKASARDSLRKSMPHSAALRLIQWRLV